MPEWCDYAFRYGDETLRGSVVLYSGGSFFVCEGSERSSMIYWVGRIIAFFLFSFRCVWNSAQIAECFVGTSGEFLNGV